MKEQKIVVKEKKVKNRKRPHRETFYLNDEELKLFKEKVASKNMTKQSYILAAILEKPILQAKNYNEVRIANKKLHTLIRQVSGIATNINQLAIFCHLCYAIPTHEELIGIQEDLQKARKEEVEIWRLLKRLISQLKAIGL